MCHNACIFGLKNRGSPHKWQTVQRANTSVSLDVCWECKYNWHHTRLMAFGGSGGIHSYGVNGEPWELSRAFLKGVPVLGTLYQGTELKTQGCLLSGKRATLQSKCFSVIDLTGKSSSDLNLALTSFNSRGPVRFTGIRSKKINWCWYTSVILDVCWECNFTIGVTQRSWHRVAAVGSA